MSFLQFLFYSSQKRQFKFHTLTTITVAHDTLYITSLYTRVFCKQKSKCTDSILPEFENMEIRKGFYDLCLPYDKDEKNLIAILDRLYECKYNYCLHSLLYNL